MNLSVAHAPLKQELAERLVGSAKVCEKILVSIFTPAMQHLEAMAQTRFDTSLKERVWNAVSKKRLEALKKTLILEFCENFLGDLSDNDAYAMLKEHQNTGTIKHIIYKEVLQTAYRVGKDAVMEAMVEEAHSFADAWILEMIHAIKQEGILFPEQGHPLNVERIHIFHSL